jgi:hypothetical protein
MAEYYSVTVTTHDDPSGEASFLIEPPIKFLSDEKRDELVATIRNIILSRMGKDEDEGLQLSITHNLPDDSATVGRAKFYGLQLATGVIVLQQALELGLNGTNDYVSPDSPLNAK